MKFVGIALLLLAGHSFPAVLGDDDNGLNDIIDSILWDLSKKMVAQHQDYITIPPFHQAVQAPLLGKVEVSALGGHIGNLSTVVRTTDTYLNEDVDSQMTIGVGLGIQTLQVNVDALSVFFWGSNHTVNIGISDTGNSIYGKATMYYTDEGNCSVTIDKLEVQDLGSLTFAFTPSSFLHWVAQKTMSVVFFFFKSPIKTAINNAILTVAQAQMSSISDLICDQIPH